MPLKYESDRLILQTLTPLHASMVYKFYKDNFDDFAKFEILTRDLNLTVPYQRKVLDVEKNLMKEGRMIRFYLFERSNPFKIIGTLSFRDITQRERCCCTIGYKMDTHYRRQGFMSEAISTLVPKIVQKFSLHRVEASILDDNYPSMLLLEQLGFEQEGLLRENLYLNGCWRNNYIYAKLF